MSVRLVKIIDPTAIVVGGLVPKGAYNNSTAYSVGDSVSYNGSSYVCITASTGNLPTDTAYWQLVASKGDTGPTGPAGTTDYNELDNLPTLGTAAAKDIPATGNASATEVVYGTDTRLTDSRPASDVSAWAKAPTKPTYTNTEVGAAATAHTHAISDTTGLQTAIDGKQGSDPTLAALAAHNTNGILTQTAADIFTGRTITGTANQVNVTNGNGVAGNPTLSLPQNIHSSAVPTFAGLTINGDSSLGVALNANTPNTNTAPQVVSQIRQNSRGIIDAVGAMSGLGDYFYCLDRNPTYTITTTGVTNVAGMFDNDPSGGADIAVANLATTPAVIEIVRADGGRINFTDVLTLWIAGHRLWNEEALTSYMVETKCSDGVWRTELDRTGVNDQINGVISIPLHVYGATYASGDNNGYHACHGIRLTIRGATAPSWNSGKFRIAELQLRDSRPSFTPARGLGALDLRGGGMYGDISLPSISGTKIGTTALQKLGFYGATPVVRPSATPADATDLASAIALVNDLKAKLIALGLIS